MREKRKNGPEIVGFILTCGHAEYSHIGNLICSNYLKCFSTKAEALKSLALQMAENYRALLEEAVRYNNSSFASGHMNTVFTEDGFKQWVIGLNGATCQEFRWPPGEPYGREGWDIGAFSFSVVSAIKNGLTVIEIKGNAENILFDNIPDGYVGVDEANVIK